MAFLRPTAAQIIARVKSDIHGRLPGSDANLRRTVEGVLARVLGGASHGLHGHIQHQSKQIIPSVENDEEIAERWGDFWLGTDGRKAADVATGSILVTGTPTTSVPTDTVWQRADGERYLVDSPGTTIDGGGSISTPITAESAGEDGNADVGTTLTIVTPISGVDSTANVEAGGLVNGTDIESVEDLIGRVELRVQSPPKGGADGDYIQEMLTVSGVTRGWEFALQNGPGTVVLYFVMDDQSGSIIPGGAKVTEVQVVIDAFRPVTAIATVVAPTAVPLNASIQIAPSGDSDVEAAVNAQLTDYLQRRGDVATTLLISEINEAISLAQGETDHILISPASNKTHTAGQIPVLGTTTFAAIP
jgi:uncharacterized phage protein gp47/JayE